ncbi:ISAs1 family transposase [Streptomyces sp. NPDC050211]|uniref:ISAs1 family transposase n=1 Tax=Streptomyces sp. NPDC050211 TaxID=3154932 RepID=UPI00341E4311
MAHTGEVLAQRQVTHRSNEISAFAPLLGGLDLTDTVITADALHTQHGHGRYLRARGAHYLAAAKANHPGLHRRLRRLPWRDIALDHYAKERGHQRIEIRRLKTAVFAHLDYPDAVQALQAVRRRRDLTTGKLTIERHYLVTSLPPGAVGGAQLAAFIRGHWLIENRLHHVRDRTFREDESKVRTGRLPRAMPAYATWPSDPCARTAGTTSPPDSGNTRRTSSARSRPSAEPDQPGHIAIMQRTLRGAARLIKR